MLVRGGRRRAFERAPPASPTAAFRAHAAIILGVVSHPCLIAAEIHAMSLPYRIDNLAVDVDAHTVSITVRPIGDVYSESRAIAAGWHVMKEWPAMRRLVLTLNGRRQQRAMRQRATASMSERQSVILP